MSESRKYDVVIIGAGIGGLVCGCYLAKAGLKTLIVEQHHKPGGYCTSFKRKGFSFDAAAHSFGSCRENGNMQLILKALDIDIDKDVRIKRYTPSDIVITPDYKITFWEDVEKTIHELQSTFPAESVNIRSFFRYLVNATPVDFASLRQNTFQDLLDRFLIDNKLKAILSVPIFGNGALPPSLISAFTGSKIFTEFILDGGYYPEGGMQTLSDALARKFIETNGNLKLSSLCTKIKVQNNTVKGVILQKEGFIPCRYIVSNCDARQTFLNLLGAKVVPENILEKIHGMVPSLSTFILYLGIDHPFSTLPKPGTNVWFLPAYDYLQKAYSYAKSGDLDNVKGFMVRFSPDRKTVLAFVNAPFKSKPFWERNKNRLAESFIDRIQKYAIPNLSDHIIYKETATPQTLYRYTLNYKGAAYGWASLPAQVFTPELRQRTSIKGLYLAGHWTTHTQGIPGVAYIGLDTARLILRKEKSNSYED